MSGRGFINISDGSITPTPPPPSGPEDVDVYEADEQFANLFWRWGDGEWIQHTCPAGTIFDPHVTPGPVCMRPQDYNSGAPYVLDDPSLEGAG